ncbi:SAM-dependent methyltransferase [Nocardia noduli]|uniref:SAM-dependent methyltransferase n=1 Tax=Nocardia noduli TaxID=2815722 RepID=UPI001C24232D|nr:class I SAM-dependent methyltransferase [Nocardia noduli]
MSTDRLRSTRFPKSSRYHPDWIRSSVSGGANSLWLTEWLTGAMDLRPGMRILDLGCGRGASSVFLHNEFDVEVWSTDLWFDADDRRRRIIDADAADAVFPVHADARALPFAADFFDAVVSIDSFPYYGTDDLYLGYLARFVAPGGQIGIAGAGLSADFTTVPDHLAPWWEPSMACLHTAAWWREHWARSGVVDIERADTMPEGWTFWRDWQREVSPNNTVEIDAITADAGRHLGYVRAIARRRPEVVLDEPITTIPTHYERHPVFRSDPVDRL